MDVFERVCEVGVATVVAMFVSDCEVLRVFVFGVDFRGNVLSGHGKSSTSMSMSMIRERFAFTSCG